MSAILAWIETTFTRWADAADQYARGFRNPLRVENYFGYRDVEARNDPQSVHHHPIVYILPGLEILIAVWFFLAFAVRGGTDAIEFIAFISLAGVLHGSYILLRESRDVFVLTVERVFRISGIFDQKKATAPVSRLLDITVDKPFFGRMLGYGHLILETAAQEQGLRELRYVPHPDQVNSWIDNVRAGMTPLGNQRR
jgi:uncharacterized membrane protein YdbT with pleckstrin-like domain